MARTKGGDDLFRLIHSLTPEEKGYYKKMAKRHSAKGNNYIRLFDAINNQEQFEENSLKKDFKNYTVMKVYLKDMITDSLLMYHKFHHPHIELFNQIQKVHILLIKGMVDEATKILRKALLQSKEMELFAVERYLLRVYSEINQQQLSNTTVIRRFSAQYKKDTEQNGLQETDLTQWELLNTDWFATVRSQFTPEQLIPDIDIESIYSIPASSTRSEIKKLNCLHHIHGLKKEDTANYEVTLKQVTLSYEYKKKIDSSFNNIYIQSNHITNCIALKKFDEALALCDRMVQLEVKQHFFYDLAFIKARTFQLQILFLQHKFAEGVDLARKSTAEVTAVATRLKDYTTLDQFLLAKLMLLYVTKSYQECWISLQDIDTGQLEEDSAYDYADLLIFQLMLQFDMGNHLTLKNLLRNTTKKFKGIGFKDYTYETLLTFFKNVKATRTRQLAAESALLLTSPTLNKVHDRKLFGLLPYANWLSAIAEGEQLSNVLSR